jgi:hypothetical protein
MISSRDPTKKGEMRTPMQLVLSVLFLALTAAPARADLIIYDMFGAVSAFRPGFGREPARRLRR